MTLSINQRAGCYDPRLTNTALVSLHQSCCSPTLLLVSRIERLILYALSVLAPPSGTGHQPRTRYPVIGLPDIHTSLLLLFLKSSVILRSHLYYLHLWGLKPQQPLLWIVVALHWSSDLEYRYAQLSSRVLAMSTDKLLKPGFWTPAPGTQPFEPGCP